MKSVYETQLVYYVSLVINGSSNIQLIKITECSLIYSKQAIYRLFYIHTVHVCYICVTFIVYTEHVCYIYITLIVDY